MTSLGTGEIDLPYSVDGNRKHWSVQDQSDCSHQKPRRDLTRSLTCFCQPPALLATSRFVDLCYTLHLSSIPPLQLTIQAIPIVPNCAHPTQPTDHSLGWV